MNPELMTEKLQEILMKALQICTENKNPELTSEHLMAAFLNDSDIADMLNSFHTDINRLIAIQKVMSIPYQKVMTSSLGPIQVII